MAFSFPTVSAALIALGAGLAAPVRAEHSDHACTTAHALSTGNPTLDEALESASSGLIMVKAAMLDALARSPMCFPSELTKEEWEAILVNFPELLPPTQAFAFDPFERYWVDTTVWRGVSLQGASGQALRTTLTYSFPNDGVTWGLSSISATGPNVLNARLTTLFGAANLDLGREYFRASLAGWRRWTSLNYSEVADNNAAMAQDVAPNTARGDIRMGGRDFGTGSFLAYNAFPSAAGLGGVGGSDMCMNTSFFNASAFNNSANSYRYLRNTVSHEHGHGLGNIHSVPCNSTKLMEPGIHTTTVDMLATDEIRGGNRSYGDRYAGNHASGDAKDFGDLAAPVVRSVLERNLSTNGSAGPGGTNADWFKFSLSTPQSLSISVAPQGGTYTAGQQSFSCSGSTASINATNAGNLNVELYDGSVTLITSAASGGAGATETIATAVRPAGTYFVRVIDVGPNAGANQTVQLYNMTIRLGSSKAPPLAIAGLSKRIGANTNCFFLGDLNTISNETGVVLENSAFEWDLDGDGSFEVSGNARPSLQYVSNGVYPVAMRVTEPSGPSSVDVINVTVFGATTTISSVAPMSGDQGAVVPVTLAGTNFRNVNSSSHVTVSGSGVTVSGTPAPNAMGTSLGGLSFAIAPGAAPGPRNVTVSNADGTGTGTGVFVVNEVVKAPCPADLDGDGNVGPSDLATLLGAWAGGGPADFDGGGVGPSDLATLLGAWGPCP